MSKVKRWMVDETTCVVNADDYDALAAETEVLKRTAFQAQEMAKEIAAKLKVYTLEQLRSLRERWDDESKGGIDPYEVDKFLDWLASLADAPDLPALKRAVLRAERDLAGFGDAEEEFKKLRQSEALDIPRFLRKHKD